MKASTEIEDSNRTANPMQDTSSQPPTEPDPLSTGFADIRPILPPTSHQDTSTVTFRRLLWIFAVLMSLYVILHLLRPLVHSLQYASSYAQEKAKVDAALEGLEKLNLDELSTAFRLVAQRVGPGVVQIRTLLTAGENTIEERMFPFGPQLRVPAQGQGSGVIIDSEGYIVTNNHVIEGAEEILVRLSDGRELSAQVIGADILTDLAILKVDADDLIAIPWGDSDVLEPGDMVWAVGSPFGLERSVTFGIVSAKGRNGAASQFQEFLQTDAAVNPGNSGGPLVNIKGQVIGVNTAIFGQSYRGISFAIPSAKAKSVYERIREDGKVARGWLGIVMRDITPQMALEMDLAEAGGVLIRSGRGGIPDVIPGSPADRGGIQRGDIIVGWNSQPVRNTAALSQLVADTEIGSHAKVELIRAGRHLTLDVVVAERTFENR